MGQPYAQKSQQNKMYNPPPAPQATPIPKKADNPNSQFMYQGSYIDPNRGDPNVRKAAPLVVNTPAPAPAPTPATPTGPTPAQIAAQQAAQQAAAIAAQQAAFWAQHDAAQRMRNGG